MDIVERLRAAESQTPGSMGSDFFKSMTKDAATEIEKLRAEVERLRLTVRADASARDFAAACR